MRKLPEIEKKKRKSERDKRYYLKNSEKIKIQSNAWYYSNLEKAKANNFKWAKKNPEKIKIISKKWRERHPDKHRENAMKWRRNNRDKCNNRYHLWLEKNRELARELSNNWKHRNPDKVLSQTRKRRCLKLGAEGSHTFGEWEILKAQYNYTCPCCGRSEPEIKLEEDHKIPLSKNGTDYIWNIQPLCKSCNCRKRDKLDFNFIQRSNQNLTKVI